MTIKIETVGKPIDSNIDIDQCAKEMFLNCFKKPPATEEEKALFEDFIDSLEMAFSDNGETEDKQ